MVETGNRGSRKKEKIVLVIGFLLFAFLLLLIDPSFTAYTSMNKFMSNSSLSFIDLIVILIGAVILFKLIVRKK